jgi:hypothetical protein
MGFDGRPGTAVLPMCSIVHFRDSPTSTHSRDSIHSGEIVILAARVWWSAMAIVPSVARIMTAGADVGWGRGNSHDGRVVRRLRDGSGGDDENDCCHRMNF